MKVATTNHYGPANVLKTREIAVPEVGEGEVLVEIRASAVTAGDVRLRAADFPGISAPIGRLMFGISRPRNPVQGTMFAGRVVKVGSAVTAYAVGDDVFGSVDRGAYAEYLLVSQDAVMAKMPENLNYDEAASIPYGAGTAMYFLRDLGEVQPGERVLILGASGGVGRFAVQIAKHLGAEVTAVSGRSSFEMVRELGADFLIDHRNEDFAANGERYDLIFDIADASSFGHSRKSLTPGGRYLTLYMTVRVLAQMAWTALRGGQRALTGVAMPGRETMTTLRSLAQEGLLKPVMAAHYKFEDIALAHEAVESGRVRGNVVVRPVSPNPETVGSGGPALQAVG